MPLHQPYVATYRALNVAGEGVPGDVANHSMVVSADGVETPTTNTPTEASSGLGYYELVVTAAENIGEAMLVLGSSSTPGIELMEARWNNSASAGGRTVTVTVTDTDTDPIQNASVRLGSGSEQQVILTDVNGVAEFGMSDGTHVLAVSKAGYSFTPTTVVVDGDESVDVEMDIVSITPASDPAQSNAYATTRDGKGNVQATQTIDFWLKKPPSGSGQSYNYGKFSATSDVNGLLQVALIRLATYAARRGNGKEIIFVVDDTSTYALPQIPAGVTA